MRNLIIALACVGMAIGVTLPKLYAMTQIRGWIPGAVVRMETVSQKWNQTPAEHPDGRDVYWISWGTKSIREVGPHRLNVEPEEWPGIAIGSPVEIVTVSGDPWPHTRNGIFASNGQFVFDGCLLLAEAIGALLCGVAYARERRLAGSVWEA